VHPFRLAVSDHRGSAEMQVAVEKHAGCNTFGTFAYDIVGLANTETVETFTIDEIVGSHLADRVDVIKMDIEGAELFALLGARNTIEQYHPVILIEISDRSLSRQGCTSSQVWNLLEGFGYKLSTFDPFTGRIVPTEKLEYVDSINVIAR
jgi:hypothetical protein